MKFKYQDVVFRYTGVTLIEMLIVVGMIAILASIAIPQYKTHLQKTTVAAAVEYMQGYMLEAIDYYAMNSATTCTDFTPTFKGLTANTGVAMNQNHISEITYYYSTPSKNGTSGSSSTNLIWFKVVMNSSKVPSTENEFRIGLSFNNETGIHTMYCGVTNSGSPMSLSILPANCQIESIGSKARFLVSQAC